MRGPWPFPPHWRASIPVDHQKCFGSSRGFRTTPSMPQAVKVLRAFAALARLPCSKTVVLRRGICWSDAVRAKWPGRPIVCCGSFKSYRFPCRLGVNFWPRQQGQAMNGQILGSTSRAMESAIATGPRRMSGSCLAFLDTAKRGSA